MAEHLLLSEMAILSQVSRLNAASLRTFPVRELEIPARLFQNLFSQIHKFPKLHSIGIEFQVRMSSSSSLGIPILPDEVAMIETPNTSPFIRTVTIAHSLRGVPFPHMFARLPRPPIPVPFLNSLLARTPQIKEFNFINNSFPDLYFTPQVGMNLSGEAKANLTQLAILNVSGSDVHPTGLLELLQSSNNYVSLNLNLKLLHNGHLREIVRSQNLTHLNLQGIRTADAEELNFQTLSELHHLTHFVASDEMSEDDLIAIIESNPNLQDLDISHCPHLQTDRVLFKIAEKNPSLHSLKFSDASQITRPAFMALIDRCLALKELEIPCICIFSRRKEADLSPEQRAAGKISEEAFIQALNILQERGQLEKLNLDYASMTDSMLDTIVSIPTLTHLSLGFRSLNPYTTDVSMLTEKSLLKLKSLTNLEELTLNGISSVTETVLASIANHCSKLRKFHMNNSWDYIRKSERPTLQPIQQALQEGRLPNLEMLSFIGLGIDQETTTALGYTFPKVKIRHGNTL